MDVAVAVRSAVKTAPRAMRADAFRNREAILLEARKTFEEEGVLASLDGIALRAGVGNATLYRNFPTRDDLLFAVMEVNLASVLADADEISRSLDASEAVAEWLFQLTWHLRIWHNLPYCIASARSDVNSPINPTNSQLIARTRMFLDAAKAAGAAARAVTAEEVFELVTTLSWGVDRFGDDEQAARRRVRLATGGIFVNRQQTLKRAGQRAIK